ncbi:MAG: RNA methyltransferase [Pseudomonadota bacterium]
MSRAIIEKLIQNNAVNQAINVFGEYLTEARRQRIESILPYRMSSVHVAVESPSDPHNAAAIVRSCEALGAMSIHAISPEDKSLHAKGTTQGAFYWVNTYHHQTSQQFFDYLRDKPSPHDYEMNRDNIIIAGACIDGEISLEALPVDRPICLLFGNEKRGLSAQARQQCDVCYHIPMYGVSESLNLSVSAAISLYSILGRKRQHLQQNGDCSDRQKDRLRLQYYIHSLDDRLVKNLLKNILDNNKLGE